MGQGQNPKIIVEYDARTELAEKKLRALEERVKAQEAVYNTLNRRSQQASKSAADASETASKRSQKANKDRAKSAESAAKTELKWLHRTRWDIITVMFYYRLLSQVVRTSIKLIQDSLEEATERGGARVLARSYEVDLGRMQQAFREVAEGTISMQDAIQAVQAGLLQDQGQFADKYVELWRAALIGGAVAGEEAADMFSTFVEAMAQGDAEILDSQTNLYQARLAVEKYADSVGVAAKDLDPLIKAQIIFNSIMEETEELVAAGGDELLAQDKQLKTLGVSWGIFTSVLGTVAKELYQTGSALEIVNDLLMTLSRLAILASANAAHFAANIAILQPGGVPLGVGPPALIALRAAWALTVGRREAEAEETPEEAYNRVIRAGAEAMGLFSDKVDRSRETYERFREEEDKATDYGTFADHILKRQDLFEEHDKRMTAIAQKRDDRMAKIELDHQKAVLRIHKDAFDDRIKAFRDHQRSIVKETAQYNLRDRQELEDHLRDLRQAEEKYQLGRLHDQRLYNYERMMLVAEGDVLAIEDLDARYELEQQAAAENQQLQQRHRGEDYREEQQQRKERFDLELREMQQAYEEKLREISIRERELLDEQITRRYEALQEAQLTYDEEMRDEQDRHAESLLQWNQYWATLAERTELGASTITKIIKQFFGAGGESDQIVDDFYKRWTERQGILARVQAITAKPTPPTPAVFGPPPGSREEAIQFWRYAGIPGFGGGYQHGGSGVARRPTLLSVGEGHTPERFSIEPAAGIGHHMSLSWAGGPIPLQGQGLEGANLGGLGDAITQGIVVELVSQLRNARR